MRMIYLPEGSLGDSKSICRLKAQVVVVSGLRPKWRSWDLGCLSTCFSAKSLRGKGWLDFDSY